MLLVVPKLITAGLRMLEIARAQSLGLSLGQLIAINLVTSFYALFLPGLLAAGAIRWYKLAKAAGKPAAALAAIGFSRLIEIEVTLAIGLAFWLSDPLSRDLYLAAGLGMSVALALCLLAHAFGPALAGRIGGRLARRPEAGFARRSTVALIDALASFRSLSWKAQLSTITHSSLTHLFGIGTMILFAYGLGLEAGIGALGWVRSLMAVLLLLPISWAGVGIREVGLALLLLPYGVQPGQAVALGVLLSARALLEGAMGAVVEACGWMRVRPAPETGTSPTPGPSSCASV
jgi:hypothetical protein